MFTRSVAERQVTDSPYATLRAAALTQTFDLPSWSTVAPSRPFAGGGGGVSAARRPETRETVLEGARAASTRASVGASRAAMRSVESCVMAYLSA
jgi:hypothetical protein